MKGSKKENTPKYEKLSKNKWLLLPTMSSKGSDNEHEVLDNMCDDGTLLVGCGNNASVFSLKFFWDFSVLVQACTSCTS
jgi:hypothetical protein